MSSGGEAQAQLSTDHHGLVDAPVLTTDSAPTLTASNLHQHLDTAFRWHSTTSQPHLEIQLSGNQFNGIKCFINWSWYMYMVWMCSFYTVFSMPVLGTLQRTEASWLCLNVHGWTSWKKQSRMERSVPIHWTLFIWIGPVPEEGEGDVGELKTVLT